MCPNALISCIFFPFSKVRKATPYVLLNSWQKSARKIQCKYVAILMKQKAPLQPVKICSPATDSCLEEGLDEKGEETEAQTH